MSEVVHVDVEVDLSGIEKKLSDIMQDQATMLEIHNTFAKMCDPYVPFLHGPLSQTFEATADGVRYTQPYAHWQYHGEDFNHTIDEHPLASALWDKAMMRDRGDEFKAEVHDILVRRYNQ